MNRYSYSELRSAAESGKREDIANLGEWFERYGWDSWNGECFDADGIELFPVHDDDGTIVDWNVR